MLYLVPSPLSQNTPQMPILQQDLLKVQSCKTWVVESAKPARAALQFFSMPVPIRELEVIEIKTLTSEQQTQLIKRCIAGENIGLMSDAGCPGIADPGAELVALAHRLGALVQPLVGPSSILLAMMASGLNGQNFHFHGYLPVEPKDRDRRIQTLEKESSQNKTTQIVIETPFRNQKLAEALIENLSKNTLLCIASDLSGEDESIQTQSVTDWNKMGLALDKAPTLFLWLA
jgi:16S rRNA (cytidine1402-2'-O)-methyltransferase